MTKPKFSQKIVTDKKTGKVLHVDRIKLWTAIEQEEDEDVIQTE